MSIRQILQPGGQGVLLGTRIAQFQPLLQWTWHWNADNGSCFINTSSSKRLEIMCQSSKCWDSEKCSWIFGQFLFPFWFVAFEGHVFKLRAVTRARKSCVHKSFPSLHRNPLGGNFSSLFCFISTFVPLSRGKNLLVKALQTAGQKNRLLPKILASRGDIHASFLHWCCLQLTNFQRNNLEVSFSTIPDWNDCSSLVCSRAWPGLLPATLFEHHWQAIFPAFSLYINIESTTCH